jgi:CubicO group peptidase (beta-lactamase class C family)
MHTVRALLLASLLAGLSSCTTSPTPVEPARGVTGGLLSELATIAGELRMEGQPLGILFASTDGDHVRVSVAGDIEPDDTLRLASVSKTFLGYIALREGLGLDESIESFFPPARFPRSNDITTRMLLNHTSGIADPMVRRARGLEPSVALRQMLAEISQPAAAVDERIREAYNEEMGLDSAPGAVWCYSNSGYLMLGRMLEQSTGTSMESLLARHFGAVAPSLRYDDGSAARFPRAYPTPWPIHWSQPWVAGGALATAADALAAFHSVSEQPEFATMQEWVSLPRCPAEVVFGDDYGLALQRYLMNGREAIGHDGHIFARSMLFRLEGRSYLLHITAPVPNEVVKSVAGRLTAAANQ